MTLSVSAELFRRHASRAATEMPLSTRTRISPSSAPRLIMLRRALSTSATRIRVPERSLLHLRPCLDDRAIPPARPSRTSKTEHVTCLNFVINRHLLLRSTRQLSSIVQNRRRLRKIGPIHAATPSRAPWSPCTFAPTRRTKRDPGVVGASQSVVVGIERGNSRGPASWAMRPYCSATARSIANCCFCCQLHVVTSVAAATRCQLPVHAPCQHSHLQTTAESRSLDASIRAITRLHSVAETNCRRKGDAMPEVIKLVDQRVPDC